MPDQPHKTIEKILDNHIEPIFWNFRFIAIIAVAVSFAVAILWYAILIMDMTHLFSEVKHFLFNVHEPGARDKLLIFSIEAIDAVLMASIFLVFTYGIYELFISNINVNTADQERVRGKILKVRNIDELKSKLGKLILMVLIVKLFYMGLSIEIDHNQSNALSDLLKYSGVIVLIALSLFLSHSSIHIEIKSEKKSDNE